MTEKLSERKCKPCTGAGESDAVEAVEEAIYKSLLRATTIAGDGGRTVEAIPIEEVRRLLDEAGRLGESLR